jgi:hypothetical protein
MKITSPKTFGSKYSKTEPIFIDEALCAVSPFVKTNLQNLAQIDAA